MTNSLCKVLLSHEPALKDHYRKVCGVDIKETIEKWRRDPDKYMTIRRFDNTFTRKIFGYFSVDDYWYKASCVHTIGKLRTPTLYIHALDDPVLGSRTIEYDVIKSNPCTAIATTETGGHLGYHEGIFPSDKIWLFDPVLAFFSSIDNATI